MAWLRQRLWAEVVAVLLFGLNLLLMGLPGALIVSLVEGVLSTMFSFKMAADSYWPAAIVTGSLMPVGFALAAMRGARLHPDMLFEQVSWGVLGYLAAGIVTAMVFMLPLAIG
jgi:hypothetical protein